MTFNFRSIPIGELCQGIYDGPHATPAPSDSGAIFLGISNFVNGKLNLSPSNIRYISEEDYPKWTKRVTPKAHDIVFSYEATLNLYAIIPDGFRGCLGRRMALMRPDEGVVDYRFLYYYMFSPAWREEVERYKVNGSTVDRIPLVSFPSFRVDLPNMRTQKAIADILFAIDQKIDSNSRVNDNLQQQAAALFSSLYDRSNTEVGFTDLIQILGGGTPKTGENTYWNGNIAFFTPKDVGTPYTLITEKTISKEGLSHCNSRLYPVNTVFVTARGTVGKVGMSGVPMAMNQSCYALVGKETHQLLVYFYTLKAVDRLKHKASGAVFDAITTRDFESEQIMKLSDDDATAFLRVAEPMFQEVLNNNIENLRLSTLRDSLLPKLMSGEIDVSAVQL